MMFECIDKIYPSVSIDTVTGSICNFTDNIGGLPLKSCTSLITGYQEGSGTPSPDNVRPLHAFSSGTLTANSDTYTFTFGQSIYQGFIDWKRGVVVGNAIKFNDWNNITIYYNSVQNFYRAVITDMLSNNDSTRCNIYNYVDKPWSSLVDYEFGIANNEIRFHNETITPNPTDFKNLLISQGVEIKYPLATPIEIPIGGINLLTQQGVNNIFADCGDTTVEYINIT